nr:MAG TPA: WRKY DNA-binding domain protein [Caudoviricetes sp.]
MLGWAAYPVLQALRLCSDDGWQWRYIRDRIGCGTVGR